MRGIIPLAGRKFQLISAVRIAIIATRWEIDLSTCIFSIYIYITSFPLVCGKSGATLLVNYSTSARLYPIKNHYTLLNPL